MFLLLTYGSAFPFLHETQNSKPIFATISLSSEAQAKEVMYISYSKLIAEPQGRQGPGLLSRVLIHLLGAFESQTESEGKWGRIQKWLLNIRIRKW